jgi:tetratricopeptide (TPR) repeat protein
MAGHEVAEYERATLYSAEAVRLSRSLGEKSALARALLVRAEFEPLAAARAMYAESLDLYRQTGDAWGAARALRSLAHIASLQDLNLPTALSLLREASLLANALGDKRLQAYTLLGLARDLGRSGHEDEARSLLEEARILIDEVGDREYLAEALFYSADLAIDPPSAARLRLAGLAIERELGHRRKAAAFLPFVARDCAYTGEMEAAESYLKQGLALSREFGYRRTEISCYVHSACVAGLRGDNDRALHMARQALALLAEGAGNTWMYRNVLEDVAHCAVAAGDWPRAARLLAAITTFDTHTGYGRDPLGRLKKSVAALRAHLANPEIAAAWDEGQALTIEQAGERELKELDQAMA